MKNASQIVEVLGADPAQQIVRIKFLESGIIMPLTKDLLERKVKEGFYRLADGLYLN